MSEIAKSPKSEAFHRLAQKRLEAVQDQIRILSNLSGPSYEWTRNEVNALFSEIGKSLNEGLERFRDQKRWGSESAQEAPPLPEGIPPAREPRTAVSERPGARVGVSAEQEVVMLREMVEMQKVVIDGLKDDLAKARHSDLAQ